jgi:putative oxygen-independent coproporphyrinogen III oxidase
VYSVFFGGGTPSLFSARAIEELLAAFRARLPLAADAEITLEANPGTFESARFRDYRACGVNRLSIGIQSFNPAHLRALGRIHDGDEARRAIGIAQAQFDNINLDLMYGLPQQTLEQAQQDIDTAAGFGTAHLSAYHLTLEPNTLFHRHPPALPDAELGADMQDSVEERLAAAGYVNYETSAFARPGGECRHNLNYWRFGDYLGIGAGAHSKLSFPDRILRQLRYKQPREYMQRAAAGAPVQEEHAIPPGELGFEFMMNALRLAAGFEVRLFAERTGLPIAAVEKALREGQERGLIARDHARIAPTRRGQRFLNDLLQLFLPPGVTP